MAKKRLKGLRVAVLATDGFEQVELTEPVSALKKMGAEVEIISLEEGKIQGVNGLSKGKKVSVDKAIDSASADDYDALLLPGGLKNPDALRQDERVREFVREMETEGKPIAAICHAAWILISAGVIAGRRLTSWPGIQDDVRNAGAHWIDSALVRDNNWVSSRDPQDLPYFIEGMTDLYAEQLPEVEEQTSSRLLPAASVVLGAVAVGAVSYYLKKKMRPEVEVEVYEIEPLPRAEAQSTDRERTLDGIPVKNAPMPPPGVS